MFERAPDAGELEAAWRRAVPGVRSLLRLARDEDLGAAHSTADADITTACCGVGERLACARLVAREPTVAAGLGSISLVLEAFDAGRTRVELLTSDGLDARAGDVLARLHGPLREILAVERTILNLVARLCGVATLTRRFVRAIRGERGVVCDTRKTTPGLRAGEKYAVLCGGGVNHRMGLYDAVLVKDNHVAHVSDEDLRGWIEQAAARARRLAREPAGPALAPPGGGDVFVEVEVDRWAQFEAVLAAEGVDAILLDNMDAETLARAVRRRDAQRPGILLEASGGVTLDRVAAIARAGVDRISVGALTHHAAAADLALDIDS